MVDQLDLDFWLLTNETYPDFKPKNTWEALWVQDRQNYAIPKCGNLEHHTWRIAMHGHGKEALKYFEQM